jgi:hypothetical protein
MRGLLIHKVIRKISTVSFPNGHITLKKRSNVMRFGGWFANVTSLEPFELLTTDRVPAHN